MWIRGISWIEKFAIFSKSSICDYQISSFTLRYIITMSIYNIYLFLIAGMKYLIQS